MQSIKVAKNQLWQVRLDEARAFPAGVSAYCRSKQISSSKFYYWRDKLLKNPGAKTALPPSRFIPVEVTRASEPQNILPDPRWVAELIRHLQMGGVR